MDNYFTPKQVSEKLQISIYTVYKWIRENKISAVKIGDLWRISETELNRILGENGENKK